MANLSFVPIDDLIREVEKRCDCFVMAYSLPDEKLKGNFVTYYGKGTWLESCALSSVLNNDVVNNWNGELRFVQRLKENEDGYS